MIFMRFLGAVVSDCIKYKLAASQVPTAQTHTQVIKEGPQCILWILLYSYLYIG